MRIKIIYVGLGLETPCVSIFSLFIEQNGFLSYFLTNLFIHHTANYNRLHRPQRRGCLSVYQGRASALQSMNSISPIHWDRISSVLQIPTYLTATITTMAMATPTTTTKNPLPGLQQIFNTTTVSCLLNFPVSIEIKPIHPLPPSWIIDLMRVV
ncbi:hypothetical protein OIU77_022650 [Salix suchowensis]|uniref:Uncharacterized protein n=1 Tax=Salix suchowensis TaxID=1278906 RepID=A0ABQ9C0X6_9ROSI|nr:hypothetical protein OIU77_022650 [Salix suchowensis]